MISAALAKIEADLRQAVACRLFAQTGRLISAFCSAAAAEAKALPVGDPERRRIVAHVHEALEWTHCMLSTARSAQAAEIQRLALLDGYLRRRSEPTSLGLDA